MGDQHDTTTIDAAELDARCARFFQYSAAHAWDALANMCAPDAVFAQNGHDTDLGGLLAMVDGLTSSGIEYSYSNVRRVVALEARTVVEQHHVILRRGDGVEATPDACIVMQFDDAGVIVRVDEYLDTAALAPLFA